ncbi:hypothetical protein ACFJIX_25460 [Roseateles sp. UC29_93]|uniref:hypothetical protein n=1 Tax=Roseateles sp. UC29_93 TaxID=3350177 RepID=UPI00367168C7
MRSRKTLASGEPGTVTRLQRMPGPIQRQRVALQPSRAFGQTAPAGSGGGAGTLRGIGLPVARSACSS